jgi:hypothetical protein
MRVALVVAAALAATLATATPAAAGTFQRLGAA